MKLHIQIGMEAPFSSISDQSHSLLQFHKGKCTHFTSRRAKHFAPTITGATSFAALSWLDNNKPEAGYALLFAAHCECAIETPILERTSFYTYYFINTPFTPNKTRDFFDYDLVVCNSCGCTSGFISIPSLILLLSFAAVC